MFVEVAGGKLVEGGLGVFLAPFPSWIRLRYLNLLIYIMAWILVTDIGQCPVKMSYVQRKLLHNERICPAWS